MIHSFRRYIQYSVELSTTSSSIVPSSNISTYYERPFQSRVLWSLSLLMSGLVLCDHACTACLPRLIRIKMIRLIGLGLAACFWPLVSGQVGVSDCAVGNNPVNIGRRPTTLMHPGLLPRWLSTFMASVLRSTTHPCSAASLRGRCHWHDVRPYTMVVSLSELDLH